MAKVCGTSEQARSLKDMLHQTMQLVEGGVEDMEKAAKDMKAGWNDDGVSEIDEILSSIRTALNAATEAGPSVESALEAYAEFLERR